MFITDMGHSPILVDQSSGEEMPLGRYAVWSDHGRKPEVIATGDDLAALQAEQGGNLPVHRLDGSRVTT